MESAPRVIGRYELDSLLGIGGMGAVYLARDRELGRLVALKLLLEDAADSEPARERFLREARALARLSHPHIVPVYDVGYEQGRPFIVMEYLSGVTVEKRLKAGPKPSAGEALTWIGQLCDGLAHAHDAGIFHRDIKPSNLIITPAGTLKIVDFGIARVSDPNAVKTATIVGSVNYMAPEQFTGGPIDGRTDVFAVGAVLYELVAGRQAFPGTVDDGVLEKVLSAMPPPLSAVAPSVDRSLEAIATRALQKSPSARYQHIAEMRGHVGTALARLAAADPPGSHATTIVIPGTGRIPLRQARPGRIAAGVLTAVAVGVVAWLAIVSPWLRSSPAPGSQEPAPATPAAIGDLLIDAAPWAEVIGVTREGGPSVALPSDGTTPLTLSALAAGAYVVTLRDAAGTTKIVRASVAAGAVAEAFAKFDAISALDYVDRSRR